MELIRDLLAIKSNYFILKLKNKRRVRNGKNSSKLYEMWQGYKVRS